MCCACLDKRPHSASYKKYIDGVGFVLHGTRQERYCWYCKGKSFPSHIWDLCTYTDSIRDELLASLHSFKTIYHLILYLHCIVFWDHRIAASSLRQSDTRIPDIPDQTGFLNKWFDWHRGYTVMENDDGIQERWELRGELLSDVAPGQLPRAQDSLGSDIAESEDESRVYSSMTQIPGDSPLADEPHIDPEDRLFDSPPQSPQIPSRDSLPNAESRYITEEESMPPTLREILPFLRSTHYPSSSNTEPPMDQTWHHLHVVAANTAQAVTDATLEGREARRRHNNTTLEVQRTSQNLHDALVVSQHVQRRIQEYEHATRVFGASEQVESQALDVNPVTAMFTGVQRQSTERTEAAITLAERIAGQAARSHSHPSRRDSSRTDQSSASNDFSSTANTLFSSDSQSNGGYVNYRFSDPLPRTRRPRNLIPAREQDLRAHENAYRLYTGRSRIRQAPGGAPSASTRDPPVLSDLTNMVDRPHIQTLSGQAPADNLRSTRLDLARSVEAQLRARENIRQEQQRNRAESFAAPFNSHASSFPQSGREEDYHDVVEHNAWRPHASDLEPAIAYSSINPFGSSSAEHQLPNPLAPRTMDHNPRVRPNRLHGTMGQDVVAVKPVPRTEAEMTVVMECKICMEQPATVACLPCGT